MPEEIRDRSVLVTGASAGIGRVLARQLVGRGYRVVAVARSAARLRDLAGELGESLIPMPADLRNEAEVCQVMVDAQGFVGRIDAVVNNAGIGDLQPFLLSDRRRWQDVIDTNLFAALAVAQAVLPSMLEAGRGVILNVGSTGAEGWPFVALYAASKAALRAASVSLDGEYSDRGVRVLSIEIGSTLGTEFSAGFDPEQLAVAAAAWTNLGIPWDKPIATAEESAGRILRALESAMTGLGAVHPSR